MLEIALLALAGAGVLLSARMLFLMQCRAGSCDIVMSSPYSRLFGFPNALISLVYFAALVAFGIDRIVRGPVLPMWPVVAATGLSVVMTLVLMYLLLIRMRRT